jgi:RNA polymerase sigma-70 factor (ECF subfamily)
MKLSEKSIEAEVIQLEQPVYTDQEIVAGVLERDPQAGEALVRRFGPIIDNRVWRLMGKDSEHRDIVQQVFGQVVYTLSKLEDPQALEAWIGQITVSVVRKEFRRRKYRSIVGFATERVECETARDNAEHQLGLIRSYAILEKMNANDRIAFILRFVEGMALSEAANVMDCSLATAKRRICRARDAFLKRAGRDSVLAPMIRQADEEAR